MTPKEKANELVEKFRDFAHCPFSKENGETIAHIEVEHHNAKKCALIAVYECLHTCVESMIYFWQEVKQEIQKL